MKYNVSDNFINLKIEKKTYNVVIFGRTISTSSKKLSTKNNSFRSTKNIKSKFKLTANTKTN